LFVQLFCKIFNLCAHDPPTSQTDGQTDGRTDDKRSQDCALHYSASCGKMLQVEGVGMLGKWCEKFRHKNEKVY